MHPNEAKLPLQTGNTDNDPFLFWKFRFKFLALSPAATLLRFRRPVEINSSRNQRALVCHAGPDPASSFLSGFRVRHGMTVRRKRRGIQREENLKRKSISRWGGVSCTNQ
jgi:hypothetical protein